MSEETSNENLEGKPEPKRRKLRENIRRVFLDPSTPPTLTVARVVLVAFLVLLLGGFVAVLIYSLRNLFFMVILAIFFAYLIDPLVQFIRRPFKERHLERFMPRAAAIFVAYLLIFTVVGFSIAYLAPRAVNQGKEFAANMTNYPAIIQARLADLNAFNRRLKISKDFQDKINEKGKELVDQSSIQITSFFGNLLLDIVTSLPWLILVPILSFFFLKDINMFRASLLRCFPSGRWRSRVEAVLHDVNSTLTAYTRAQLISCLLIGFVCTIGFYLLGVKYALLLGIMAGIFEFVPLLGPLSIGIIATSVAGVSGSPWQAFWTFLFLVVLRLLHDYVTYPRIVREGILLHPLMIILSVLAGEQIGGIPGVFLSIPIVALLTVIYKHILEHTGSSGFFAGWLQPKELTDKINS